MLAIRGSLRTISFAALLVMVGAACGSTVPRDTASGAQAGGTAAGGQGNGLSIPAGGTGPGAVGGGSVTGGGTSSGSSSYGGSTTGGSTGGTIGGGTGGTGPGVSAAVPGVTPTTIYVGSYYTKNQGEGNAAIGATGLNQGDARKPQNVVINDINKHGGILGRKIVPIYYGWDATSSQTSDQQDQAACAKYTEDNEVFAIFLSSPILDECAKKAGAIEFGGGGAGTGGAPETYKKYPTRIDITAMNVVRMGPVTVGGLSKQNYFDKGAKIGIMTWDDPVYREGFEKGYIPALKKIGRGLATPPYYIAVPQTLQDFGGTSAAIGNAVLKFKTLGIDHVMILDGPAGVCGGACLTLEFLQHAQSQHYFPRYGFNDTNVAREGQQAGLFPKEQLRRSISVGWVDLDKSYDEGWHPNRTREDCEALMRKHGIAMSDPNQKGAALVACEDFWFLQLVINRISGPLNVPSFIDSVNKLGYGFSSPLAYANYFGPSRHDGVGAVRIMRFMDSCDCYKYVTDPHRV